MKLGLIGNCQYSALINTAGNVDWLCWPRLDSSFVFGTLLDDDKGGRFQIGLADGSEGTQRYIDNTNILVTRFDRPQGSFEVIDFAPRFSQYDRFHKPKMLIRIVRPISGAPVVRVTCSPRYNYGELTLRGQTRSNHIIYEGAPQPIRLLTDASLYNIQEGRPFVLDSTQYFVMTWGFSVDKGLRDLCENYLERTKEYWQRWVKHCHLPREYQPQVIRSALCLKIHQFEDTGAIIAATTTSIPEANGTERNWDYRFCWLRDAYFTLSAFRRLGQFEEMENFTTYLRNIVERSAGRLQPVYGITGEDQLTEYILHELAGYRGNKPVRIGNQASEHLQHDIYGEMVLAIAPLFLDARFAISHVGKPKALLERLLSSIDTYLDKEDAGLWEFRGIAQIHTFSVLMHWAGAKHALAVAEECGYEALREQAKGLVQRSERLLDDRCWDGTIGAYVQSPGSKEMDAALLHMVNIGYLKRYDPRALSHVNAISSRLATESGLLRRYTMVDDFGDTANAFTICSFWLVEALARLGERDRARHVFEILGRAANHVGLYSEDLEPRTFEQWGNFPQAYSHVGFINAAFALSDPWE